VEPKDENDSLDMLGERIGELEITTVISVLFRLYG